MWCEKKYVVRYVQYNSWQINKWMWIHPVVSTYDISSEHTILTQTHGEIEGSMVVYVSCVVDVRSHANVVVVVVVILLYSIRTVSTVSYQHWVLYKYIPARSWINSQRRFFWCIVHYGTYWHRCSQFQIQMFLISGWQWSNWTSNHELTSDEEGIPYP